MHNPPVRFRYSTLSTRLASSSKISVVDNAGLRCACAGAAAGWERRKPVTCCSLYALVFNSGGDTESARAGGFEDKGLVLRILGLLLLARAMHQQQPCFVLP